MERLRDVLQTCPIKVTTPNILRAKKGYSLLCAAIEFRSWTHVSDGHSIANLTKWSLLPPFTAPRKYGIQLTRKQRPRILEILFRVCLGSRRIRQCLIKDASDTLLFGERRMTNVERLHFRKIDRVVYGSTCEPKKVIAFRDKEVL